MSPALDEVCEVPLSRIAASAAPSATLALDAKAKQLLRQGLAVVNFTVGEPDFDTPDNIKQAAHRAIQSGFTKYTAAAGMVELRRAIADKLRKENGLDYSPEEILVSNGGKQAIFMVMLSLVQQGDRVLLPAPYWVSYADQALICRAEPVPVDTTKTGNLKLTPRLLKKAITRRAKLLVLNSPCNPTGVVLTRQELEPLVELAIERGLWILSDEIYEKLIYDGLEHVSLAGLSAQARERVITVNGLSKTYAMTGWRIGYAAGPREVIQAAANMQSNATSAPNSIAQKAALEALTGPQDSVAEMRQAFDRRRHLLVEGLNGIPGVSCPMPQGAFYAFPDCRGLLGQSYRGRRVQNSLELCEALLDQAHVAVVPGSAFGAEGYVRFSYATSEDAIQEGLKRLRTFVEARDA
jgi:aspartate aminotransferase